MLPLLLTKAKEIFSCLIFAFSENENKNKSFRNCFIIMKSIIIFYESK